MIGRNYFLALVVAAFFLLSTPASAGVLYNNGTINGNIGTWDISYGNIISDSFVLTAESTLSEVDLGIWIHPTTGDAPSYLKWRIGDSVPDPTLGPIGDTANLTNSLLCSSSNTCGGNAFDVYASSFSLPNIVLGPGTYYLTLDFGVTSLGDSLFWDVNNGPSAAYRNGVNMAGSIQMTSGSNSNAFQILGTSDETPTGVPEPASVAMLLSGLALVSGLARRKMRA